MVSGRRTVRLLWLAALVPSIALGAIHPAGASGPCCAGDASLGQAAATARFSAAAAPCCCGDAERCCSTDPLERREPGPEPAAPAGSERDVLRALASAASAAAPALLAPSPREVDAPRPAVAAGVLAAAPRCPLHIRLSILRR
jgi:hypothetical protein